MMQFILIFDILTPSPFFFLCPFLCTQKEVERALHIGDELEDGLHCSMYVHDLYFPLFQEIAGWL